MVLTLGTRYSSHFTYNYSYMVVGHLKYEAVYFTTNLSWQVQQEGTLLNLYYVKNLLFLIFLWQVSSWEPPFWRLLRLQLSCLCCVVRNCELWISQSSQYARKRKRLCLPIFLSADYSTNGHCDYPLPLTCFKFQVQACFLLLHFIVLCRYCVFINIKAGPSASKKVTTCWRLTWWSAFFSNKVLFN